MQALHSYSMMHKLHEESPKVCTTHAVPRKIKPLQHRFELVIPCLKPQNKTTISIIQGKDPDLEHLHTRSKMHKSLAFSSLLAIRWTTCNGRLSNLVGSFNGVCSGSVCTNLGCTITALSPIVLEKRNCCQCLPSFPAPFVFTF